MQQHERQYKQARLSVSILTRPGGRVQRGNEMATVTVPDVSILTRPGGRVQPKGNVNLADVIPCFNPHPSRRTGATGCGLHHGRGNWVSILTRPGGRVQRSSAWRRERSPGVSILTRPGGRVQLGFIFDEEDCQWFQSSPVPEDGCNNHACKQFDLVLGFNPHPSRRTGATISITGNRISWLVSILTRPGGRVQRRTTALNSTQLSSFSAKQRR